MLCGGKIVNCERADMRKALSMDAEKKSMVPLSRDVRPEEVE